MQGVHLRKYGVQTTINFELYEVDGVDFRVDAVHASGDTVVMKDEGAEANTTNGFTDEGTGYSIVLTATEMQAARIVVYAVDQTATKVWLDKAIVIETYGHASAMHAMDLDDAVRGGLTALPNAAADAAGGLPISDAGGLDLDAKLANTNEVTAARMGALTDWINGGRLDLLLDAILADTGELQTNQGNWLTATGFSTHSAADVWAAVTRTLTANTNLNDPTAAEIKTAIEAAGSHLALIKAVTDALPDSGALTTIGTDTARITAARAQALDDWINGGRLDLILDAILVDTGTTLPATLAAIAGYIDTEIAAIKAVTDNLPDSGALTTIGTDTARLTAARAAVLTDWIDGGRLDLLLDAIQAITAAIGATAAANLARALGSAGVIPGTVDTVTNTHTPTTIEFQADDITEATADHYNGRIVLFLTGDLAGQATDITDYAAVGGIGQFTVTALTEAPANNDTFIIV